jgi:hypothetical protein
MIFLVFTKHCDFIDWNTFVSHVKSLIIVMSQMGIFKTINIKYVLNYNFDKQSFSNGR